MRQTWHRGTGRQRKEAALNVLAELRGAALRAIRRRLVRLAQADDNGVATADEAYDAFLEVCEQHPEWRSLPTHFLGAVFRQPGVWEHVGWIQSRRPSSHARTIGVWRLREDASNVE